METKKCKKADLETRRGTFLLVGLVTTLSIILVGFEWTNPPEESETSHRGTEILFDITQIQVIPREEPKPKEPRPEVRRDIIPVDDDGIIFEDIFNDPEVNKGTLYDYMYNSPDPVEIIVEEIDFIVVEEMPLFNGKNAYTEFPKYIARNLKYPKIAAENGVEGKVLVKFIVDENGQVVNASVIVGAHPDLDNEALRVVMSSPRWTPGKQRGKAVRVVFHFPIKFVLQ